MISDVHEKDLLEIADKLGYEEQSMQLIEEMAELTHAISKYRRYDDKEDLSKANKNDDIEIKLFKGLKLKSTYVPSHVGKNPKTNKDIIVKDKIKISCKLTDYFKNKLL